MKLKKPCLTRTVETVCLVAILFVSVLTLIRATDVGNYFLDTPFGVSYHIGKYSNGTFYAINGSNWQRFLCNANGSYVVQQISNNCTANGGGLALVQAGDYGNSGTVTIGNNCTMIFETGVYGLDYITSGTGIVLRYDNGYVWFDAPLNMTYHQITYGLFHAGTTFPTSPLEAQFFYRTSDHTLYVWNSTHWQSSLGSGTTINPYHDYSFYIYKADGDYNVKNGTTANIDYQSSSGITALQYALDELPNNGGIIKVSQDLEALGTAYIEKPNTCIIYDGVGGTSTISPKTLPYIYCLYFNGTAISGDIRQCYFKGLHIWKVHFYAGDSGYRIRWNYFEYCTIRKNGATDGIVYDGVAAGSTVCDFIHFNHCYFFTYNSANGFITTVGTGTYTVITDCELHWDTHHAPFIVHNSNYACQFKIQNLVVGCDHNNVTLFYALKSGLDVSWSEGSVEIGKYGESYNMTILELAAISSMTCFINIHDVRWMIDTNEYLRIINNKATSFDTARKNFFKFHDNYAMNEPANVHLTFGTVNELNGFDFSMHDNSAFPTLVRGSSEASNDDWILHGLGNFWEDLTTAPEYVSVTVEESDSAYACQVKAKNSTHFQIYLYDIVATSLETVDKTITWTVCIYQPD